MAIGITVFLFWMIKGLIEALMLAAVLAGIVRPIYRRVVKMLRGHTGVAAMLTVLLTLAVVVAPAVLLVGALLQDAARISDRAVPWVQQHMQEPGKLRKAMEENPTLGRLLPYEDEIVQTSGQFAGSVASFVAQSVVSGAKGTARVFLMLFVTLYAMFTFLKDGQAILDWTFDRMPLSASDKQRLVATFTSVARATLKGTLLIGIVQGALGGAAFAVAGIKGAVFWGSIMAVSSIIPGIGTALVWVPAVMYLVMVGRTGPAVGLAVWCIAVVGTADNILRPRLVGKDAKMSDLMILVTTLGGLALFGATGILIGPIVGALFTTVWTLWGTAADEAGVAVTVTNTGTGEDDSESSGMKGKGTEKC
jgi:predicted PurR-regulated permease PerM